MLRRCYDPDHNGYEYYGGSSIEVWGPWHDYDQFVRDLSPRPPGTSLDRIDPTSHYEPGNVRWATAETQSNNKTNSHFLDYQGERLTMTQWARRFGVDPSTVRKRLAAGWPTEEAITTPVGYPRNVIPAITGALFNDGNGSEGLG